MHESQGHARGMCLEFQFQTKCRINVGRPYNLRHCGVDGECRQPQLHCGHPTMVLL
jgi:hypothetical protein